ncbi:MAG: universal stress protein [Halieaceae bacterium]|jgi:universal stress protein E|nr:universal stress protein [Halieaceae bacterium]
MGRLLIVADPKDSCFATPRGLELAHKLGLKAEVVAFVYAPLKRLKVSTGEKAAIKKRLLGERDKEIHARVDQFKQPGQKVVVTVVWEKDISRWVTKRCSRPYEAVVKTGHRSHSLINTSTDWQLLRECPVPVLIVAEKKWHRTKPILAAVDLGTARKEKRALNHLVIATGKRMAQALDTQFKLICALEIPTLLADLDLVDPVAYTNEAKKAMKPHIQELARAHDLPVSAFRCKRGPVAKVITSEAAQLRAQLVVIGTAGRRGVQARLLGNTAESVLVHLGTDVLAIKL